MQAEAVVRWFVRLLRAAVRKLQTRLCSFRNLTELKEQEKCSAGYPGLGESLGELELDPWSRLLVLFFQKNPDDHGKKQQQGITGQSVSNQVKSTLFL